MSPIYELLKTSALRYLPEPILRALKKRHYARVLRAFDETEEPDLQIVRHLVPEAATAIDLGANIGVYTKVLSELVGPSGRVLSVEPVPQTYAILCTNVDALGLRNVTPINAAVSDGEGTVTMEIPTYETGGGNFYQAQIVTDQSSSADGGSGPSTRVRVRATTVDSIARDAGSIAFLKVDVESHEEACLAGAHSLIRNQRPAWLIEISANPDDPNSSASRIFVLFAERSYGAWWFDGKQLTRRVAGQTSTNYFFLTDEHVARIRSRAPNLFRS